MNLLRVSLLRMFDEKSITPVEVNVAMPKKALPMEGTATANEIYVCVGVALSYWEASEDVLMGLFARLCRENEPVAFAAYVKAPRLVRFSMLRLAIEVYEHRLLPGEIAEVRKALNVLDKLATTRNEIAHGHVSHHTAHEDGVKVAEGNYLLPSYNENGPFERDFRFHHTADTIEQFTEKVRDARWAVMQVDQATIQREQAAELAAGPEVHAQRDVARRIAAYRVPADRVGTYVKALSEWK